MQGANGGCFSSKGWVVPFLWQPALLKECSANFRHKNLLSLNAAYKTKAHHMRQDKTKGKTVKDMQWSPVLVFLT